MLEQEKLGKMILEELKANELDVKQFRTLCKAYIKSNEPLYCPQPIKQLKAPKTLCAPPNTLHPPPKITVEYKNGSVMDYQLVIQELKVVLAKRYVE